MRLMIHPTGYYGSSDSPDASCLSDTLSGNAATKRAGAVLMLAAAAWVLIGAHKPDQGIAYQLSSWGNVVAQWSIEPNGQIILKQTARGGEAFRPVDHGYDTAISRTLSMDCQGFGTHQKMGWRKHSLPADRDRRSIWNCSMEPIATD
jgi:hypothetical protein